MINQLADAVARLRDQLGVPEAGTHTIELDCPPGDPRPGDLITAVIEGTGLPIRDPVSKVFGNWTWDYSDVENIEELWAKAKPMLKERITTLYQKGTIRYGSW